MAAFCLFIPSKGSIRYLARLTPTRWLKSCCFQWEGSRFQWGSRNLGIHLGVTLVSEGCETGGWNEEWSWGSLFSCLFFWLRWQVKGKREMEMEISPLQFWHLSRLPGECICENGHVSRRSMQKGQLHLLFLTSNFLLQKNAHPLETNLTLKA